MIVREAAQDATGQLVQLLARLDQSRSWSGTIPNRRLTWSSMLAVLAGHHHDDVEVGGACQLAHDERHLDGLGTSAVDDHHPSVGSTAPR